MPNGHQEFLNLPNSDSDNYRIIHEKVSTENNEKEEVGNVTGSADCMVIDIQVNSGIINETMLNANAEKEQSSKIRNIAQDDCCTSEPGKHASLTINDCHSSVKSCEKQTNSRKTLNLVAGASFTEIQAFSLVGCEEQDQSAAYNSLEYEEQDQSAAAYNLFGCEEHELPPVSGRHRRYTNNELSLTIWENCVTESVDRVPYDIDGLCKYHIVCKPDDKLGVIKDGRPWNRWVSSSRKDFKGVRRVARCRGLPKCPSDSCPYLKANGTPNRLQFKKNIGTIVCFTCETAAEFVECPAVKIWEFAENDLWLSR